MNKISIKKTIPISYILILPLCIIIPNTVTILMGLYAPIRWFIPFYTLFIFIIRAAKNKKVNLTYTPEVGLWAFCLLFLWAGVLYSVDKNATMDYCITLSIYSIFLVARLRVDFYSLLYKCLYAILFVLMISIYINGFVPNLMTGPLSFLVASGGKEALNSEVSSGIYSGLFADRASAAFGMNLGFIISLSSFLNNYKKKHLFASILFFAAIFFTGKRTLAIIPVVLVFLALIFISKGNLRKIYIFITAILTSFIGIILIAFPQILMSLDRTGTGDLTTGRDTILWPVAFDMFNSHKLLGTGINTFNSVIQSQNPNNLTLSNWGFHAHNIYIQFLGEVGIIGTLLLCTAIIYFLVKTVKTIHKAQNSKYKTLATISLLIQFLWIIYGLTGNTFYYSSQFLCYIVALSTMEAVIYEEKKRGNINLSQGG